MRWGSISPLSYFTKDTVKRLERMTSTNKKNFGVPTVKASVDITGIGNMQHEQGKVACVRNFSRLQVITVTTTGYDEFYAT